jgi:lysophospholipase L1-like esterase
MKRLLGLLLVAALGACAGVGEANAPQPGWAGAWGASPNPPPAGAKAFENQTIRQVVRLSAGGTEIRIRFSNEYGEKPLQIGAASVARIGMDGKRAGPLIQVTFSGKPSVSLPAGAPMLSDPVKLGVDALDRVSISVFLPTATGPCTCHFSGIATSFISSAGDFTRSDFEPASTFANRAFISSVDVATADARTIVPFGDSITDGTASSIDRDRRWPDVLAERLEAAGTPRGISNQAIAGNRVLSHQLPIFGESALTRFDRDVLSVPNASWVVVLEGVNDLGMGAANPPSAETIIHAYRQIIARAHAHGVKVYGATLLPYEGARYYQEAGETVREAVNAWIRSGGECDRVIDFDAAMRDPANPKRMKSELQSGDWLHPNDAGYKVMGESVDLTLFR